MTDGLHTAKAGAELLPQCKGIIALFLRESKDYFSQILEGYFLVKVMT